MKDFMKFNQKKFNDFVLEHKIIGFFPEPLKLVSGRTSSWYVNWRNMSADAYLIDVLSDFVLDFCRDHQLNQDCFYGTPDGATKLAVICQYKWAKRQSDFGLGKYVLAMGRKTPKDHGDVKDKFFVGAPKGKIVVIEDVTTTGGSLIKTVDMLQKNGYQVTAALALTSRNERTENLEKVADVLAKKGVNYLAMSNAFDLLPEVVAPISQEIRQSIVDEFVQYGEAPIKL